MMKVMLVAGARPNFMKVASIIDAINAYNSSTPRRIEHLLVHTGQHYDEQLSHVFFKDLSLPQPDIDLGVGSSSHAHQTAEIMNKFEPVLLKEHPDVVLVVGDVNSTVACSLVASKITYAQLSQSSRRPRPMLAHVEAGLRSYDRSMPEEINRLLTDAISDFLFITEKAAGDNLRAEGIPRDKIYLVGNTMVDTLLKHRCKARASTILWRLGLKENGKSKRAYNYGVVTLHRPSNVDNWGNFEVILEALSVIAKDLPLFFPVHPRTLHRMTEFHFERYFDFDGSNRARQSYNARIRYLEPLGYLDFLCLMSNAKLVLTDSGGIQEETTVLGIPCVTVRENTERPATVSEGTNVVAGTSKDAIIYHALKQMSCRPRRKKPKYWDGRAGRRIIKILTRGMK